MLSSNINPDDNDETDMPGDYESWPRVPSRTVPPTAPPSPPRNTMRSPPRPRRRSPPAPSTMRPPIQPAPVVVKPRRRRSRPPPIPDIVIDRRHGHNHHHHHHHHHRSSGGNRIITIPLDNRPTLGLRGNLPRQVLEIERVRCRRRRRCRSPCYEIDYHVQQPLPSMQPQPNVIFVNPTSDPLVQPSFLPSANNSSASLTLLSTLTPEMIETLPKRTIHLPPIHLPGSQADATTKLQTVMFPAEVINPIDGTLSIIRANSASQTGGFSNIHYPVSTPVQPQLINTPINNQSPLAPLATLSGPFMEQVHDLVQRITHSQGQSVLPYSNQNIVQPSSPMKPQYNVQTVPATNALNTGPYHPANIRPTTTPNMGLYNPSNFVAPASASSTSYPSANITPYRLPTNTASNLPNTSSYRAANITPYGPANITPYQPTRSPPSYLTTTRSSYATNTAPTNVSYNGPYGLANITPHRSLSNQSDTISTHPPLDPHRSPPHVSFPSVISAGSLNSDLYNTNTGSTNTPYSPQPYSQVSNRTDNPMPKSILRNTSSNRL